MKQCSVENYTKQRKRGRHAHSGTRVYASWKSMTQRCHNPNSPRYARYGGRGIKICQRWQGATGFINFLEDMGERPEDTTLDRIDSNGNYEPGNCRWADANTQASNRPKKAKRTGVHRVCYSWCAKLKYKGETVLCKYFHTFEEAVEARRKAELEYLGYTMD